MDTSNEYPVFDGPYQEKYELVKAQHEDIQNNWRNIKYYLGKIEFEYSEMKDQSGLERLENSSWKEQSI